MAESVDCLHRAEIKVQPMSKSAKTVVFVTFTDCYGGTEKHLIDLIRRLDFTAVKPVILCYGIDPYSERLQARESLPLEIRKGLEPRRPFGLWSILRSLAPDTVLFVNACHGLFPWTFYVAARLSGAKRVYAIEHLIAEEAPKFVPSKGWLKNRLRAVAGWRARHLLQMRLVGTLCDLTICVSEAVRRRLVEEYSYRREKTITIRNGVEVPPLGRYGDGASPIRMRLAISTQDRVAVCVARLAKMKGLDVLLQAAEMVSHDGFPVKWIVVGDGPLKAELSLECARRGLSTSVFFEGFQQDVGPYYEAADVFVLPSYKEGLPLVLLEAMAVGLPCAATDVGGSGEAITHGRNGLLIQPGSPEQLASAVKYLLSHAEQASEIGTSARKTVQEHFDVETTMQRLREALLN